LLTVPILDEDNRAVSTENDSIVALLQKTLGARRVIHLIEAPGLLEDRDDPSSVVASLRLSELEARSRTTRGRLQRKLMALATMTASGCDEIVIADGRSESPLGGALSGEGTRIRA
jgi:acetylglutamate kinase